MRFFIEKQTRSAQDCNGNWTMSFLGYELDQRLQLELGMDNALVAKYIQSIGHIVKDMEMAIEIGFAVKDPKPAEKEMLEKAVKNAKEKAEIMVMAASAKLGDLLSIDYSWRKITFYSRACGIRTTEEACCFNEHTLDIHPADDECSDTVQIVWNLE